MNKRRVLVLMHEEVVPPESLDGLSLQQISDIKTEWDIVTTLEFLGHEVLKLGVADEVAPIRRAIESFKPHLAFNLLEAFHGRGAYDQHVVAYLELLKVPYSGCNPRGLTLARDKALSKKILHYHRIRTPRFAVFPRGRKVKRPRDLEFPLFVKSLGEDASYGIAKASLIPNDDKLIQRVGFVHDSLHTDAIAEEFIAGRELFVPVLGNVRLTVLPVWELVFRNRAEDEPLINTERAKFNVKYQNRVGVDTIPAGDLTAELQRKINKVAKRIYRALGLSGYARIDFRLDNEGRLFFLEANPNPDISEDGEAASAALAAGVKYEELIQRIVNLGLNYARTQ